MIDQNKKSKSFKNVISGLLGYGSSMLVVFISTPLILNILGAEQFGIISLSTNLLSYFLLLDFAIEVPLTRFFSQQRAISAPISTEFIHQTLSLYILIGFVGFILIQITSYLLIYHILDIDSNNKLNYYIATSSSSLIFISTMISSFNKSILNGEGDYTIPNIMYTSLTFLTAFLGVISIYFLPSIILYSIVKILVGIFLIYFYIKTTNKNIIISKLSLKFNLLYNLKQSLRSGFYLRFTEQFVIRFDQILISIFQSVTLAGYYSIASLLPITINNLLRKLVEFIFPKASELFKQEKNTEIRILFEKIFFIYSFACIFLFSALISFGHVFLTIWLGKISTSFIYPLMIFISSGIFLSSLSLGLLSYFLIAIEKYEYYTKYLFYKNAILCIMMILIIYLYGSKGAAILYLISGLIDFLFFNYTINKIFDKTTFITILKKTFIFISYFIVITVSILNINLYNNFTLISTLILSNIILFAVPSIIIILIYRKQFLNSIYN